MYLLFAPKFSHSWDTKVKQLLCDFNLYDLFLQCTDKSQINIFLDTAKTVILKQDFDKWNHELWNDKGNGDNGNKLRTYRTFKSEIGCEQYLTQLIPRHHRRVYSSFRCGSLPLRVETGRYSKPKTPLNDRLCQLCKNCDIENEKHFFIIL